AIKGFRKGHVPRNVLVAHLGGPEALRAEAIREALPDFYARAVADTSVDPIGQPAITVTAGEDDGALAFDADVEVRPEVDLVGYRDLRVTIPSPQVTDDELDAQVDRYRETDATLREVERPIATGDLVTMDLTVTRIASEDEPVNLTDYMYTVGSGSITDGVDELILGLRAGEDLTVNGSLERGGAATYEMRLKQVQERELPELTDEWVAENTEWASVDEMRDAIMSVLRRRKVIEAQLSRRDATLAALADLVPATVVPDTLAQSETEERLHDLGHRLAEQKVDLATFLTVTNQSSDELLERLRADAERAVRVDLALRGLVRAESLEPTDQEVDEELERTAASMGVGVDRLRENLRDNGRVGAFRAEVAKVKASRWLNENLTFVDPTGVVIDPELLRAEPESADA
ncbi:MAG TPA: trigger factor, partial [Acidimicrobiales bacterium]|nr:trigger factor [Acidimicrobiales bacterium]